MTMADIKLSPEQLHQLFLKYDLSYFAEKMLDMEIVNHHKEWSEFVAKFKKMNILSSRDHGKSFFFSFAYVIWRLYYNWIPPLPAEDFKSIPRVSLGYIFSASQEKAVEFLDIVKKEIETNPRLARLLPDRKDSWSKTEIRCSNGATVRARGWGAAVRGGHPVWLICDDVLSDENIYSEVTRQKSIDYFYSAITPMIIPGGQQIVVGTPMHQQDLYGDLKENEEYHHSRHPAVQEDGTALWPTRYNLEMLKQREKEVGSIRFAREYLCLPVSEGSTLFPDRILKENYETNLSLVTQMDDSLSSEYILYTGVDLALSAAVGADFTAIVTVGMDKHKNCRIFDLRRFKGRSMTEQLREIEDVYYTYRPELIYVEDNQFQRVFRDELVRNTDLPVQGFTTTAKNKNCLERGVPSLQVRFENQKFMIPRKTERDRRLMDIMINELKCFTWMNGKLQGVGAHDDCLRKGAMIQTNKGFVPIERVRIGDRVLTHTGSYKKVTNFIKKPYKGDCIKISPFGSEFIEVTPEHPVYVSCKRDSSKSRESGFFKPKWIPASEVEKGKHRMIFPINSEVIAMPKIDLLEGFADRDKINIQSDKDDVFLFYSNYKSHRVRRYLEINEEFCRFIGLYLAEGSARKTGQCSIALHINEVEYADMVEDYLTSIGITISRYVRGKCLVVSWCNKPLAAYLFGLGKHDTKKLPPGFLFIEPMLQRIIVDWWIKGDGWNNIGATTSIELANQMYIFLLRNGVVSNIRRCDRRRYGVKTKDQWWVEITGEGNNKKSRIFEGDRYSSIKTVEISQIDEFVYNLEVEGDESYVVNHTIVHNCVMALWIAYEATQASHFSFSF